MKKLSVGFVAPLPPVRSGVADYAAESFGALKALADVRSYAPEEARRAGAGGHDVLLFHVGNDPLHAPSVEALADSSRKTPAALVLHDFSLHHLFAGAYLDAGRFDDYRRELVRSHGERGRELAERNIAGPRLPVWDLSPWSFPMSLGVADDADAVLVHSRLVRGALLRERPRKLVVEVPHHVVPAERTPRDEARRALSLPLDRPVAVTLGVVTPAKRIGKVIEALAALPSSERPFLFVGGAVGKDDPLHELVSKNGLEGDVAFGGYLSEEDFWRAASAADLAVNLRFPTVGETSGAVCRLAGFGVPLVVSDVGWFKELPDSFAAKIPVGEGEVEALARELTRVAFDEKERERRSSAAAEWGRRRSPERVAQAVLGVLSEVVDGRAPLLGAAGPIATALLDLGIGASGRFGSTTRLPDGEVVARVASRGGSFVPARRGRVDF